MSAQIIADSFRKLPPHEKVRLLQQLWDEIAEESVQTPLSEPHRQLLDDRLRQHEESPDDVEPWGKA